jgi:hypothetical protein
MKEPRDIQAECWSWGRFASFTFTSVRLSNSRNYTAISWDDPRPLQGLWRSRLVAKPGAKGAEKHIFLIDSPGVVAPMTNAQAAHYLSFLFFSLATTNRQGSFLRSTTLTIGKPGDSAPRINALVSMLSLVKRPLTQVQVLALQTEGRLPSQVQTAIQG